MKRSQSTPRTHQSNRLMKKLLIVLCTLALMLSAASLCLVHAATPIAANSAFDVYVDEGETVMLEFTSYITANYTIYSTTDLDTYVTLYDDAGNQLAYNDDVSEGCYDFELTWTLQAGETYTYGVRFLSDSESGDITGWLTLDESFPDFTVTENDVFYANLSEGGCYVIKAVPSESAAYSFYSLGDNDTIVDLYDADLNWLSDNDDGGRGTNFKLVYDLEAGETYYYVTRFYNADTTGFYDCYFKKTGVLTYDGNGSSYDMPADQTVDEYWVPISTEIPANDGCEFLGWSEAANPAELGEGLYQPGDEILVQESATLYAVWGTYIYEDSDFSLRVNAGEMKYVRFVPDVSGEYTFCSNVSADTVGTLYDAAFNELTFDDDGGEESNFSITYSLEAYETYYLGMRYYSSTASGTIKGYVEYAGTGYDLSVILSDEEFVYNGAVQLPEVTVVNEANGEILTEGEDYTVSYRSPQSKFPTFEEDPYAVDITGINNYEGYQAVAPYVILPQPLDASRVTLEWDSIPYNRAVQQPAVTVKNARGGTMTAGSSYNVSYSASSMNPGTYRVTVTGVGPYTGTVRKSYTITKQPLVASRVTLEWTSREYNGTVQQPAVTVKNARGGTMTEGPSYTVSYSASSKNPGTYRVTVTGAGAYTGSVSKYYTIVPQQLVASRVTLDWTSIEYNGAVQQPTVTVKNARGGTLTAGSSYNVSYSASSKNPGTYRVTVTGAGAYAGSVSKNYTIVPQQLVASRMSLSWNSIPYNGAVQQPTVILKNARGGIMTEGSSYTVSYSASSKYPGTYRVTATAAGAAYTGSVSKTYTITQQPLDASRVTLEWDSATYNGAVQQPTVTVKNARGGTLTAGSSYNVVYSASSKNPGTYRVTVSGAGAYTGSVSKSYTIVAQPLDASRVVLSWTQSQYNGAVQQPTVTVTNANGNVMSNKSYTVTYSADSKVPGTYQVVVTAVGAAYTGRITKSYTITKQQLDASRVTLSATSFTYDGKVHKPTVTVKNANGYTMTENSSYKVTYSGACTAKGTYTVTITGQGYYAGTVTKTFTIR